MTLAELNGHLDMLTQLKKAKEALQTMQVRILGAQDLDGMPHSSDASRTTENLAILLEAQLDDVMRLDRIVERSEKDVRVFVDSIEDNRTKVIFNLRFLCGLKWEDVAAFIGGGNTADAVKAVCYRYLQEDDSTQFTQKAP